MLKPENVVFELGFFIGKLGPAYVAALLKSAAEKPSGFDGIAYIPYGPVHPGRPSSRANAPREIPSIPQRFLGLNSAGHRSICKRCQRAACLSYCPSGGTGTFPPSEVGRRNCGGDFIASKSAMSHELLFFSWMAATKPQRIGCNDPEQNVAEAHATWQKIQ
jgi:hypothetical protein